MLFQDFTLWLYTSQKKCEVYWPENAEEPFVPVNGSPLTITYKSVLPFAEFVVRKMVATHVSLITCHFPELKLYCLLSPRSQTQLPLR